MIYFYVVPMYFYWVAIVLSIYSPKVSKYTQIEDTACAVGAFILSLIPILNIISGLACLADSRVRFHK